MPLSPSEFQPPFPARAFQGRQRHHAGRSPPLENGVAFVDIPGQQFFGQKTGVESTITRLQLPTLGFTETTFSDSQ